MDIKLLLDIKERMSQLFSEQINPNFYGTFFEDKNIKT